jgi:hypothetical protein
MAKRLRSMQISFTGNGSMSLEPDVAHKESSTTREQKHTVRRLGAAIKAYLSAARDLLGKKYAHIRGWAPAHLAEPGNVLVVCCRDGAVVRYEKKVVLLRISCLIHGLAGPV